MNNTLTPSVTAVSPQSSQPNSSGPNSTSQKFTLEEIEQSILDHFERQVAGVPERTALKSKNQFFTYDQLNRNANRVARAVLDRIGPGKHTVVSLSEHGASAIVASLGALKAGKIDVPLDSVNPGVRLADVVQDSQASMILADTRTVSLAKSLAGTKFQILNIDEVDSGLSCENVGLSIPPDSPARIIYTSGSTGRPKGVVLSHRRILHEVMTNINGCYVSEKDRLSLVTSPFTSQGTVITYTALLSGAALCLFDLRTEGLSNLTPWLNKEEISVYTSVRAIFRHFASQLVDGDDFPHLRFIGLGGDEVRKGDVELYKQRFSPQCLLKIFLSSTETGNICQYGIDKTSEIDGEIVPVGFPAEGVEVLLLDDQGRDVAFKQIGEIAVKSRYLADGYWRLEDLTSVKFRPDPAGGDKRIYFTGDLGRRRPDGCIEYLGRKDFRVKIHGFGVEPGEIESVILSHGRVRETVVTVVEQNNDTRLIAYITPTKETEPTAGELRSYLTSKLPGYMVPSDFIFLDALPLTPMGKIDRLALPIPDSKRGTQNKTEIAPRTPLEKQLAEIWCSVLEVDRVGVYENFFDLGGQSLLASDVISLIREVFSVNLPFATLLANPTVEAMASIVLQYQADERTDEVLEEALQELEHFSEEEAQRLLSEESLKGKV